MFHMYIAHWYLLHRSYHAVLKQQVNKQASNERIKCAVKNVYLKGCQMVKKKDIHKKVRFVKKSVKLFLAGDFMHASQLHCHST